MRYRFTLLLAVSTSLVAGSPEEEKVIGVVTINHELPTAFYEPAPRSIRLVMERTLAAYCAGPRDPLVLRDQEFEDGEFLLDPAPKWLCADGKVTFVRAVSINGYKSPFGAVCANHTRGTIYYPVEWIHTPTSCVPIGYDRDEKRHYMGLWPPWDME